MPTPSLLIVPARFKTGRLYSQIPTSGAGDFTVTRNTEARRFDSAGLVASVASGIPRLDYYTSGGVTGCPALLVEPAATNLFSRSNDFLNSGWVKVRSTITSGTTTSPDGTLNASTINCDASGTAGCWVRQTVALSSERTASIFVKPNTAQFFQIQRDFGRGVVFNLASGTIKESVTATGTITPFPNGWYRCTAHFSGTGETLFLVGNSSMTVTSWSSNLNESLFIYEAQMEAGTIATSPIPTTAGTGSRSADVISVSGAVSGSIGQTEGTIYFEYYHNTATNAGIRNAFNLEGNVANQFNGINFATSNNGNDLQVAVQVSSSSVVSGGAFSTSVSEGWHKVAFGYNTAATGTVFYFDGNLIATRTLTNIPVMSRIALMARANPFAGFDLDRQFNNRIRAAALYTTRLSNAELASLTAP